MKNAYCSWPGCLPSLGSTRFGFLLLVASGPLALSGCPDAPLEDIQPDEEETDGNATGAAPDGGPYNGCLRFPVEGESAFRHQCEGAATVLLRFDVVNAGNLNGRREFITPLFFGPDTEGDSYERPRVMACCRELESDEEFVDSPHISSCYHDMVENGCRSMVVRLRSLADDREIPLTARNQVNDVADWLAGHLQECRDAFWLSSGAAAFDPEYIPGSSLPESFPEYVWDVPDSANTFNIRDLELELVSPLMLSASLPENRGEWLSCESQEDNNDVSFLQHEPGFGFTYDLENGSISVAGMVGNQYLTAEAPLASTREGCGTCSLMSFEPDRAVLDALVLESGQAQGGRLAGDLGRYMDPERYQVALYEPVGVEKVGWEHYRVAARAAHLVLSVMDNGAAYVISASNAGAIELKRAGLNQPWVVKPFKITYEDAEGSPWSVYVSELRFE